MSLRALTSATNSLANASAPAGTGWVKSVAPNPDDAVKNEEAHIKAFPPAWLISPVTTVAGPHPAKTRAPDDLSDSETSRTTSVLNPKTFDE
ncbi:MAG: hypothetical protein IJ146_09055 [Kiritimatiellae bacterium]|nr:hypothetical protein [Kiritimatiellia bacterium]